MSSGDKNINITNQYIELKSMTWSKDSHGLFDYENQSITSSKFKIDSTISLYRNGPDILTQAKRIINDKNVFLTEVEMKKLDNENLFYVSPNKDLSQDDIFFIVRTFKKNDGTPKGYVIKPGDIIKLGRIEYKILECKYENLNVVSVPFNTFCQESQYQFKKTNSCDDGVKKTCKICFLDEETLEPNSEFFFISPCKCKGSCEFVHLECLKGWLNNKITPKGVFNTLSYNWKKLECEVCKQALPKEIEYEEKKYNLIPINKPDSPYIILENISRDKSISRAVHVVQLLPSDQIKLGRGHQCDLRISDISVSRLHAYIKYENGEFILYDNNSKFGTLVLLQNPYQITYEKIGMQIGRTVISLALKPNDIPNLNSLKPQTIVYQSVPNSKKIDIAIKLKLKNDHFNIKDSKMNLEELKKNSKSDESETNKNEGNIDEEMNDENEEKME